MLRKPLDDASVDRLFDGALDPEDAPPGYAVVAGLVRAAKDQVRAVEPTGRAAAVASITAAVTAEDISPTINRRGRRTMLGKLVTLKALGIALPAMALTAGSAAAATGALPAPAQATAHDVLSHLGISVPKGSDNASPPSKAVGPDATGAAKFGLCTASQANAGHASSRSVAFANLEKAANAANESIQKYCAGVTPPTNGTNDSNGPNDSSGTNPSGTNDSSGRKGTNGTNHSKGNKPSTPAGPPASNPASGTTPVTTPAGPPSSTPAPGTTPVTTPAGPPSSTPGGKR